MFAGFDYGTSNCSIGLMDGGHARLVPLEDSRTLIPSTMWALRQDLVVRPLDPRRSDQGERRRSAAAARDVAAFATHADAYSTALLTRYRERALRLQRNGDVLFGSRAMEAHFASPDEGFYVKSPKSFLGARGLNEEVQERFVDIVAAMMANIIELARQSAGKPIEQLVIGRPVNFQGAGGAPDNARALAMVERAARINGVRDIQFLFEPMAAAMELEARLARERLVLVVDIGGGTTDCSFVRIGPKRRQKVDRSDDVLGHSGERMGGNDYDQALAFHGLMPQFGLGRQLSNGLPVPNIVCMDAVSINDVNCQQRFYSATQRARLLGYVNTAREPKLLARLLAVRDRRLTYRLVRAAELAKIALSELEFADAELAFIEPDLRVQVERGLFLTASARLLAHLKGLVSEVLRLDNARPDAVYLTGGMARSTFVRAAIAELLPDVEVIDSDHFASVTEGLTLRARQLFG